MKLTDMRSLPPAARQARRMQVVALRAAGSSYRDIAAQTGLSRTGVFDICKRVDAVGAPALADAPKGRQTGHGGVLDAAQCGVVRALIFGQTPDRLSLPYPLWTKAAVIQLIGTRLGIRMSDRTVALYLARWGLRPPKPMAKAYLRSAVESRLWLGVTYPGIAARARKEDAEINWVDESEMGLGGSRLSVFSTVNNRGQMRWAAYAGALDARKLIALLRRRTRDRQEKSSWSSTPCGSTTPAVSWPGWSSMKTRSRSSIFLPWFKFDRTASARHRHPFGSIRQRASLVQCAPLTCPERRSPACLFIER